MPQPEVLKLLEWFDEAKRDLPWRILPTPYRVWISEVMLQQTQASVVIPYFTRWMQLFPHVKVLAEAPFADVLKAWEGLGYYSRARNIHKAAQLIVERYQGELPDTSEELSKLPGLGNYTVNAILAFAFRKKALALDANVMRVLARFFGIKDPTDQPKVRMQLRDLGEKFLECEMPWEASEALIELGALVCNKNPQCLLCPLENRCKARQEGVQALLPVKRKRAPTEFLNRQVAVLTFENHYLLACNEKKGLMQDLWEFPYFHEDAGFNLHQKLKDLLGIKIEFMEALPFVKQSFTRFRALLKPSLWICDSMPEVKGYAWHHERSMKNLAFSSGHKKILHLLYKTHSEDGLQLNMLRTTQKGRKI